MKLLKGKLGPEMVINWEGEAEKSEDDKSHSDHDDKSHSDDD